MKKRIPLGLKLIGAAIVLILISLVIYFSLKEKPPESSMKECVPKTCCHASECALKENAPDCKMTMCTMECKEGTMDCGAGSCAYVNGKCEVVWNEK